ncbi:uncharacterized protein LOC134222124 [Armigeres subalbatus]|uniref:uncharacterized protein LOC134222124 n=1 Tax=Armigeres subalbatus TaxID=124917 RepID=UPI002ED5DDAA
MHCFLLLITFLLYFLVAVSNATDFENPSNYSHVLDQGRLLIYPSLSVLQFSMATATSGDFFVPRKKYAVRRLGINLGFQANYNLPYRLQDFYKFPTWARAMVDVVKGRYLPTQVVTARAVRKRSTVRPLSAGDIYTALEDILEFSGYDKDCLLKSVCELSHSPFHDLEEDLYAEIVHFFLTPSEHQAFDVSERKMKRKYELAERFGKMGADCTMMYPECRRSFLMDISDFIDDNKMDAAQYYVRKIDL